MGPECLLLDYCPPACLALPLKDRPVSSSSDFRRACTFVYVRAWNEANALCSPDSASVTRPLGTRLVPRYHVPGYTELSSLVHAQFSLLQPAWGSHDPLAVGSWGRAPQSAESRVEGAHPENHLEAPAANGDSRAPFGLAT